MNEEAVHRSGSSFATTRWATHRDISMFDCVINTVGELVVCAYRGLGA
jgi:hypothetical protein